MSLFRRDPAAGLAKAQAALAEAQQKIAELEAARQVALQESDALEPVHAIDSQIAAQRAAVATHADRVQVLKAAVREQQAEETERQRQAALVEVQKRLDAQVELAREVEAAVKQLGDKWNELLQWRQAIIGGWPDSLPRPLASDFEDQRQLIRELATALFSAGKPRWDKPGSIPAPASPIGVEGLSPKSISGYVAAAGQGFLARIKAQRIDNPTDDESEAA
jgi:hypothetical protein